MKKEKLDEVIPPNDREKIEENFKKVKNDYHPKRPYHWAWKIYKEETKRKDPSVLFLAEHFNELPIYYRLYSSGSAYAHGSPVVINLMKTKEGISLAPIYSDLIFNVGFLSLHFCFRIVKTIFPSVIPQKSVEVIEFTENYEYNMIKYLKTLGVK